MILKRVNIKDNGTFYENRILIETIAELNYYHDTIFATNQKGAAKDLIHSTKESCHTSNELAGAVDTISKCTGKGGIYLLAQLAGECYKQQMTLILAGAKLCINNKGGYFPLSKDAEIIPLETQFKYTVKDINVTKYDAGKHYYATVGGIPVIDADNDSKWNTYEFAEETAIKFMNKLNAEISENQN